MASFGRLFSEGIERTSQEIEARAKRLDGLLWTLAVGVIETAPDERIMYANPAALRILGATESDLAGKTAHEAGITALFELGAGATADGQRSLVHYVRSPDVDVWLDAQVVSVRSESGERTGAALSFVDATERVRLEAAEQAARGRMDQVLQSMAAGVLLVDAQGRIQYANPASGLNSPEMIGQLAADPAWQLTDAHGNVVPYDNLPVPTVLREGRPVSGVELGVPTMQGEMHWMRVSAQPLVDSDGNMQGAVVTTETMTERHKLAEQLLQAQKIETVGQLAGGIAHDFNNLLTVIIGNTELALALAPDHLTTQLTDVRDAAQRGADLTRQLLTFARKDVVQALPVNLGDLADSVDRLLHRAVGEGVSLHRKSVPDLWPVLIDQGQMEQVMVNMAINARDAMPTGGAIAFEMRNATLDAKQVLPYADVEPGDFVLLSIKDSGTGMSSELVASIFDPFFTTKPAGTGTGLGLSICHGVVKQAQGFIAVDSEIGQGTTFTIHLPRCTTQPSERKPKVEAAPKQGSGTILLVEDQDAVRHLVERALSANGYHVVSARGGHHALALKKEMQLQPDLLLTDIVMPEMSGPELAKALQERTPNLPVLFMTGYVDPANPMPAVSDADGNLLMKPFTPMELLLKVKSLLARAANVDEA